MAEHEIYHRETGSLGEHDEYWTLVLSADGKATVRHDQSWGNPHRGEVKNAAPKEISLKEFAAVSSGVVGEKLADLLRKLRIDPNA